LRGRRYGRLEVIDESHCVQKNKTWQWYWVCVCDCGALVLARGGDLQSGDTKSCGCLNQEQLAQGRAKQRQNVADRRKGPPLDPMDYLFDRRAAPRREDDFQPQHNKEQ
jgi:hypothetical protein